MEFQNASSGAGLVKREKQSRRRQRRNSSEVKVVYISTPMKVKTSASRFRSLVQHLTGRHSDIALIMEANGATDFEDFTDDIQPCRDDRSPLMTVTPVEESPSPSSSESQQLEGMFPIDLFLNLTSFDLENDVLGSYDSL